MRAIAVLTVFMLALQSSLVVADIAVIVNANNQDPLDEMLIRKIFLSKVKNFSNGETIKTYLPGEDTVETAMFVRDILRKSNAQLNSYWSRMIFSSKGIPPEYKESSEKIKQLVEANANAIGVIRADAVDESVRVVLTIDS